MRLFLLTWILFLPNQEASKPILLSPASFPGLPGAFRAELQKQGCLIPQAHPFKTMNNVISGSFAKKGQTDWAVLCSVGGVSNIVVHWGGSVGCRQPLEVRSDNDFIELVDVGSHAYLRAIGRARPFDIMKHARDYASPSPFPIDHDGIDDMTLDKGSVVLYCRQGRWYKLQGAD